MNIYISGQVLGQPIDYVAAVFNAAACKIRCAGHTAVNPLDLPVGTNFTEELKHSDVVYFLHNYRLSKSAMTEEATAVAEGIKVLYEENPSEFWQFVKEYNERGREALINDLEGEAW